MRGRVAAATVAVAALALTGCGSSTSPAPSPTSSATATPRQSQTTSTPPSISRGAGAGSTSAGSARTATSITIKNFAYQVSGPAAPGATVHVTNDDTTEHTVTADSGHGFDVAVPPGKTATFTAPHAAGRYRFHCNFHSDMHGTLTVTS